MKCTYVEEIATDDLVRLIAMCALIYSLESLTCEFYYLDNSKFGSMYIQVITQSIFEIQNICYLCLFGN